MKKLLLILLCLPMLGFGQNVNIPDANFKAYLVGNTAINTNGDNEIQVSEATAFTSQMWCNNLSILDLTGIESFTNLDLLGCGGNQLTSLDISSNTALTYLICDDNQLSSLNLNGATSLTNLSCEYNQLTSIDLSSNTALTQLSCRYNQLTSLDLSSNIAVYDLICNHNQLTSLDVSNNTALIWLHCTNNQLTSLNVSANTALQHFYLHSNQLTSLDIRNGNNINMNIQAFNNASLFCINVDDAAWSAANWTVSNNAINSQHYFSTSCSGTAIQEHTTNKELLKVTDLLGRETKQTNQPLFYIYDDGTVEKRIVIE